jgi:acetoin utilization deacetylase AcuC-like enzyme
MKVFYDPRQTVANNPSFSPSAGKPALVVESWQKKFPVEIMDVEPVTADQLKLVHKPAYVDDILSCRLNNGFDNRLPEIAESLKWTNGSFLSAAVYAAENKISTVSPTSGFHHAEWDKAIGFCTFNGLALAAHGLMQLGLANKIAIADLDCHYGNGTDDIIKKLGIGYIKHYTYGKRAMGWDALSLNFDKIIERLIDGCDILFYQAGADPHEEDPYGGYLTTQQLKLRDRIVFVEAKRAGIPVVWNLAGGYQTPIEKVLEIHDNTARMHLEVFGS